MPFDATKPASNSPMLSAEMRAQLNALKDLIDAQAAVINDLSYRLDSAEARANELESMLSNYTTLEHFNNHSANTVDNIDGHNNNLSNPPTFVDVNSVRNKLNELLTGLRR